jgi:hypothetical protein
MCDPETKSAGKPLMLMYGAIMPFMSEENGANNPCKIIDNKHLFKHSACC